MLVSCENAALLANPSLLSTPLQKAPVSESERSQTVIKLLLSLPYDGETSNCDAVVERFPNCSDNRVGQTEEGRAD